MQTFQGLAQKITGLNQTTFVINNFSDWSSQAIDDEQDLFTRPTEEPETALGRKKQDFGGPRGGRGLRGRLGPGADSSSRTADLFWFQKYNNGGKRDKVITSTLSNVLKGIK